MKRLIFSPGFPPDIGGWPNFVYARCLASPEHLEVIAARLPGSDEFDSRQIFPIHRFDYPLHPPKFELLRRTLQISRTINVLKRYFKGDRYDVLEVSTVFPGAFVAQIFHSRRNFYLISYALGDDILKPLSRWYVAPLFRFVLKKIDMFVAISQYTKNLLLNAGVPSNKIVVIHPPIDQQRFGKIGNSDSFKKTLPPHNLILLTISRLVEKKGIDRIIELMPRLKKKFPGLLYVVGGYGEDLVRLQKLAHKYCVTNSVIFLGQVPSDKLADVYAASNVFIMPTRTDPSKGSMEGFGIVFLEAGSQGIPAIGPRGSGSEDVIIDGITGYLVNPYDLEEIECRIVELLSDYNLRQKLGEAGRKRAFQFTDWASLITLRNPMIPATKPE